MVVEKGERGKEKWETTAERGTQDAENGKSHAKDAKAQRVWMVSTLSEIGVHRKHQLEASKPTKSVIEFAFGGSAFSINRCPKFYRVPHSKIVGRGGSGLFKKEVCGTTSFLNNVTYKMKTDPPSPTKTLWRTAGGSAFCTGNSTDAKTRPYQTIFMNIVGENASDQIRHLRNTQYVLPNTPMFLFLDFPRPDQPPLTLAGVPERVIVAHALDEVRPALRQVQAATKAGYYAVGYVSYEASPAFDPALRVHDDPKLPLVWFGLLPPSALGASLPTLPHSTPPTLGKWEAMTPRADYDHAIARVHAAIARGDTYQANYTVRLHTTFSGDDVAFFRRLRAAQQPSYNAYLNMGRYRILSVSPELFIHWRKGQLTTKPMKGTVRRGYTPAEDAALAEWLATSEKNQAENVMIVDLLRNDISRVAELGTVRVPRLFEIEPYPTVFQMTSTVTATPRPDLTLEELFTAMFPCGSVTGAPKVSTMRLLNELEPTTREVYCGAIGVVCPDGEAVFNVAIRTVWLDMEAGTAEYGVGGGITWDSVAAAEYDEVLAKAAVLGASAPDFELLETLRLENGEYYLLERHLARMAQSAAYFGYAWDEGVVRERLEAESGKRKAGTATDFTTKNTERTKVTKNGEKAESAWRVRLLLAKDGSVTVESTPIDTPFTPPWEGNDAAVSQYSILNTQYCVALHHHPTFHHNRFLYHKTTHRAIYEEVRAAHPGAWDVLLWNESGELMEFTIGNVVVELDGHRYTPPLSSGLLAGTFRAELLERGEIEERVVRVEEVQRATRVWLINSVRGWVEVQLIIDS
jgi:para-aminobenzoate synthetase/4-amino-4-deoxychorismate lyase